MKTRTHADVIHEYAYVVWTKGDTQRLAEFMQPDVRLAGLGGEPPIVGLDKLAQETQRWLSLFVNPRMRVVHTITEVDRVAWQWELHGTIADLAVFAPHMRAVAEQMPETRDMVTAGISISTFEDGLITEEITQSDVTEFLGNLGYPPKS